MSDDITGREKNEAEEGFEAAGKAAGRALANSRVGKSVKKAVLSALGPVVFGIILSLIAVIALMGVVNLALAIKEGFIKNVWSKFAQISQYDEPRLQAWNDGGDPDKTALIYQQIVSTNNAGEPLYLDKYGSNDAIDSLSKNSMWRDVMRNEHILLAQEDMKYILQRAYDYNNEMFRMKHSHYTYQQWRLSAMSGLGMATTYNLVKDSNKSTETSNEDGIYDNLTREHIEGEEDENGDKRFASHWQDAYALAYFYNLENMDNWGISDENTYDPNDRGIDDKETLYINSTDGYYITDADLQMICDLFEYNFTYYWDEIAEPDQHYTFSNYLQGNYTTGYRYRRLEDPDDNGPFENESDYYRTNQNRDNPYEYLSYPDHLAYDEHSFPMTQFTPESVPNTISNTIESYKYIYTPIYASDPSAGYTVSSDDAMASLVHLDEAGETGYTPDPDNFMPPNGDYCIGRWHVVDPRDFIDTLAILCPWYKGRSEGDGVKWVERSGYNWVQEMIDHYNMYLELLPGTSDHTKSRMDYFNHLADLYTNKKIEVFYEGTKYEGMDDYLDRLTNQLLHPEEDIYVAIDIDGTLDLTKDATNPEALRAGALEAFKWMENKGIKYVILTENPDLEAKKNWVQTNILSRMHSTLGYKGTYRVPWNDRYQYCHSHGVDILVDDASPVISIASLHMPVIEMHCSDWSSQPSGGNIFEIDSFTEFSSALTTAASGLHTEVDYSDWTVVYDDSNAKDTFYNYQQKPESKKYPFYSYGVTYHNKEKVHIGGEDGEEEGDDDPGGGVLPDVGMGEPANQVYLYGSYEGKHADEWYYLYDGADEPLDGGVYYSKSQIQIMLGYLESRSGGRTDYTSATDKIYQWNQETGADVAAMFAIIINETGCTSSYAVSHWNFFNFTASDGEPFFYGSNREHRWWDGRVACSNVGDALLHPMNKILNKYWRVGQNTYYKMCFNQYGYPQTREEAMARNSNPGFSHCFCPWWQDTGFLTTGHNSAYSWCNKNAKVRKQLIEMASG